MYNEGIEEGIFGKTLFLNDPLPSLTLILMRGKIRFNQTQTFILKGRIAGSGWRDTGGRETAGVCQVTEIK